MPWGVAGNTSPDKSSGGGGFFGALKRDVLNPIGHAASAAGSGVGHFFGDIGHAFRQITTDVARTAELGWKVGGSPSVTHQSPAQRKAVDDYLHNSQFFVPFGREMARRIKETHFTMKWHEPGTNPFKNLAESPFGMVVPGVQTLGNLAEGKKGLKFMGRHPGYTFMDVAPYLKGLKAGSEIASVNYLKPVIAESKLGTKIASGARFSKLRAQLSKTGAEAAAEVHAGLRQAHETVRASMVDILSDAHKLSLEEQVTLGKMLQGVETAPAEGHPLRQLFDDISAHQAQQRRIGISYQLPTQAKTLIRAKVLERQMRQTGRNLYETMIVGLTKRIGPEDAARVTSDMADAFLRGKDNPYPEFEKTWKNLNSYGDKTLARAEKVYRLHEVQTPVSKEAYAYEQARRISSLQRKTRTAVVQAGKYGTRAEKLFTRVQKWSQELETLDRQAKEGSRTMTLGRRREALNRMINGARNRIGDLERRAHVEDTLARKGYFDYLKANPAGRWKAMLEESQRAVADLQAELISAAHEDVPMIRQTIAEISDSLRGNWMELAARGENPVYLHRMPKLSEFEQETRASARATVARPGSTKAATGLATTYERNPFVMMLKDEFERANTHMTHRVLGDIYERTGGTSWSQAARKYQEFGWNDAQVNKFLKNRYMSLSIDNGKVILGEAKPGELLLKREVGTSLKQIFDAMPRGGTWDKFLEVWLIPTLFMAPVFHINNIFGGAELLGIRLSPQNPIGFMRDFAESFSAAREGRVINPKIPTGIGMVPRFHDILTPSAERAASEMYGVAARSLMEKLALPGERLNAFFDNLYRNFLYLNKVHTGHSMATALDEASKLMQDYDHMLPIEKAVFSKIFPFWTWKRTLLRVAFTYPVDHPFRMTVLNWAARDHEQQRHVSEWMDRFLMDYLPVGHPGRDGLQKYVSLRGVDAFPDYTDMGSLKGWLQAVHPLAQTIAQFVTGYDPFLGGTPAFVKKGDVQRDPTTGQAIRKYDYTAFFKLLPELQILQRSLGLKPPAKNTPEGWWKWWQQYGPPLRLLPGLRYVDPTAEEAKATASTGTGRKSWG